MIRVMADPCFVDFEFVGVPAAAGVGRARCARVPFPAPVRVGSFGLVYW